MRFEVNWQTKFGYPLDRYRLFQEIIDLDKLKNQQIEAHKERQKRKHR